MLLLQWWLTSGMESVHIDMVYIAAEYYNKQPTSFFPSFFKMKTFYIIYWDFLTKTFFDSTVLWIFFQTRDLVLLRMQLFEEKKQNWQEDSYFEGQWSGRVPY